MVAYPFGWLFASKLQINQIRRFFSIPLKHHFIVITRDFVT